MMLRTVLFVFGCVGAALSQRYPEGSAPVQTGYRPPQSGYERPTYGDDYSKEIYDLVKSINGLMDSDIAINERERALRLEDDENSEFTDRTTKEIFIKYFKAEDAQNRQIEDLQRKAQTLLNTKTDIYVLNNTLREIADELVYYTGPAVDYRENMYQTIVKDDYQNDENLEQVMAALKEKDYKLSQLETRSHNVKDLIEKLTETLHQVFDNLNSENGETVLVTLTPGEPEVTKYLSVDFKGRRPQVVHGITLVHVSNHNQSYVYPIPQGYGDGGYGRSGRPGYGGGYGYGPITNNPSIYFNTDVNYDQDLNMVTATFYDLSTGGWSVNKVQLNIVVFNVDNRVISTYPPVLLSQPKQPPYGK